MTKLLIDYANRNDIILNIDEKDKYGDYPLLQSTFYDNIEIFKLIIEYANRNDIILNMN